MAEVRYIEASRVYPGTEVPAVNALDLEIAGEVFLDLLGEVLRRVSAGVGIPA